MTQPFTIGPEIDRLTQLLARLPGLGPRSARRAVLQLLRKRDQLMGPLVSAMQDVMKNIKTCETCGNLDTTSPCAICSDHRRDPTCLIIVKDVGDLWALERAGVMRARYHILGGLLSPLDGVGPDTLNIKTLMNRVGQEPQEGKLEEIILALDATVEGQTTSHYITDLLKPFSLKVTRLAHGMPVGGELDYLDEGTISAAMRQRTNL
jgi:recombination protein RecR